MRKPIYTNFNWADKRNRKAHLHRAWVNFWWQLGFNMIFAGADRVGIDFWRKGETVCWLWSWARKTGAQWLSLGCEGSFNSLQEVDAFWDSYQEMCEMQGERNE